MAAQRPKKKPGRPLLYPERLVLPLPSDLAAQAKAGARREGVPVVEWIREAMRQRLPRAGDGKERG